MSFTYLSTHTRVVAKVTLCLWLFGLMAGIANACLIDTGRDHLPMPSATALAATDAGDDCDQAVGQQACKSLRDLEQGALVKAKVLDGADNVPALGLIAPWRIYAATPSPLVWQASATPPPGPPVAILFLRLTL